MVGWAKLCPPYICDCGYGILIEVVMSLDKALGGANRK
jgi:hypothetical protein